MNVRNRLNVLVLAVTLHKLIPGKVFTSVPCIPSIFLAMESDKI
jgi:hypothetical protein